MIRGVPRFARNDRMLLSLHFCVPRAIRRTLPMAFDLKEIVAGRLGENYELHHRHLNRTLVAAQRDRFRQSLCAGRGRISLRYG